MNSKINVTAKNSPDTLGTGEAEKEENIEFTPEQQEEVASLKLDEISLKNQEIELKVKESILFIETANFKHEKRKEWLRKIEKGVTVYVSVILFFVAINFFCLDQQYRARILLALITSTMISGIGLIVIIVKYLFDGKSKH
jgi:hypothetical protein